jgi:ATP-dependent exoDNAse (exonuclease V) beta subunit
LLRLKRYLLDYVVDKIHLQQFSKPGIQYDNKWYTCLDGTRVRSKSEQFIADWFYRHSIRYEYEPLLNVRDFEFHPDFFVPEANLYIEHVSNKSADTRRKEEQFRQGNLLLVKTYEAMTQDSALFSHVLESIVMSRLPANYQSSLRISFMEAFNGHHDHVKDFVRMVMRVTDMVKVEDTDVKGVEDKAAADQHERVREFYALALPLMEAYKAFCVNKSYLDFNDLIARCISLLRNHADIAEKFRSSYKYILVDEFQDVNNLQVATLDLLLTPDTQLFCVGDDWQSIYGFRGSNVSYIVEFEKHFPGSRVIKLNMNYRSTENIVGASNEVIKHNKFKIDKEVKAAKRSDHKIVVYAGQTEEEQLEFAVREVRQFLEAGGLADDLLFLYRRSKMYQPFYHRFKKEGWRIPGKTIHAAKGLEAKVVFIIGLNEGSGGFPDIWLEDRIFQTIKEANFDLLMEEERRLFYVAITRAKDKLYLLTIKGNESSFLKEIPADYTVKTSASIAPVVKEVLLCQHCNSQLEKLFKVCPYCGTPLQT